MAHLPVPGLPLPAEAGAARPTWGISASDIDAVLKLLTANSVIGVVAPTGSGKSTTLIEAFTRLAPCVFVSEPTVPACDSLRKRMGSLMGKDRVGQAAEGKVQYTNPHLSAIRDRTALPTKEGGGGPGATALVYCTSGHLRRVFFDLIKYAQSLPGGFRTANLAFCDVLVLDEAHGGSLDLDIIMYLYIWAASQGAAMPRLVLASATLVMASTPFPRSPAYEIKVTGYPVTVEYAPKDYKPEDRDLYPDTGKTVLARHKTTPIDGKDHGSTWIVFCPGLAEIEAVAKVLRAQEDKTLIITLAHSSISAEEMDKIFEPTPVGKRRVIITTNIAETSITINDLEDEYDTMTEKVGETSMSGGFRLSLYSISKSSARQRAGRVGRTRAGRVYRMCTEPFFLRLPEHRPNEISRVPLHSMVIETMDTGLNPLEVYQGALTPGRLKTTVDVLRMLDMVTSPPKPLAVAAIGKFAPKFPLSVRGSAVLWHWLQTGKPLFPVVSAVALIDCYGPSYFYYPKKLESQKPDEYYAMINAYYETYFADYDGASDLEVMLKMWLTMLEELQSLTPSPRAIREYTSTDWASLNNKKIMEVFNVVRQITISLGKMGHTMELGTFSVPNVLAILTPILRMVYADQIFTRQGRSASDTMYINSKGNAVYRIDMRNTLTSKPTTPRQIVALLTAEIQTRRGGTPSRFISLYHPLPDVHSAGGIPPRTPPKSREGKGQGGTTRRRLPPRTVPGLPLPGEGLPPTLPGQGLVLPGMDLPPALPTGGLILPGGDLPLPGEGMVAVPNSLTVEELPDIDADALAVVASGNPHLTVDY